MSDTGSVRASTEARIDRLRARLDEAKVEGILISNAENRRYLSGFVGTYGYLLIAARGNVLATDFRYVEQAEEQAPAFRVERIRGGLEWLPKLAAALGIDRLAFESDDLTVAAHARFQEAFERASGKSDAVELVPTTGITAGLRAVKDEAEMELLARSIAIADEAFDEVSETLEPGVAEAEAAWRIELAMRRLGAEGPSFDTIVASGPNAARPHHRAGERELREGETIVIDMGARCQGYCSDLTRTVVLGEPDDRLRAVYDVVLGAQLTAIENVAAGMTGEEADRLARVVIEEAGHGEAFGHSLGHGVGLEVHENPGVGPNSKNRLEDGMVFTVEPGVYLPGWGGVRIEDVVVLENGRARVLSQARKAGV